MNLGSISNSTSTVEVNKSKDGIWLRDGEWQRLMPYEDFPQFENMRHEEIAKVETPEPEQYFWPNLGRTFNRKEIEKSHSLKRGLQHMRHVALGLLVLMGVIFVIASINIGQYPWLGYVRAFAEAAMVGALADWFAVTALFRHPLGSLTIPHTKIRLYIPHTNIVEERKDDIGENLANFIKNRFLTRENVERWLDDIDLAEKASAWLKNKQHARELSLTLCRALRAIIDNDDGELEVFVSRNFRGALDRMNVSTLIARLLKRLVSDNHTKVLIEKLIDVGLAYFDEHREQWRKGVKARAKFFTKNVQGLVFDKMARELRNTLSNARHNQQFRQQFDERISQLISKFEDDAKTKEGIELSKQKFLNDPSVAEAFASLGVELKCHMVQRLTETKDLDPPLAKDMAKLLDRLGDMLAEDPFTRQMVNERLRTAIPSFVEESRDTLSSLISKTIKKWPAKQTSDRIELHIGRDLQFIRINGTIVGGLVGLTIYIVSHVFF